jgi:hypothetical protein
VRYTFTHKQYPFTHGSTHLQGAPYIYDISRLKFNGVWTIVALSSSIELKALHCHWEAKRLVEISFPLEMPGESSIGINRAEPLKALERVAGAFKIVPESVWGKSFAALISYCSA